MSERLFEELGEETRNLVKGEERTERVADLLMSIAEVRDLKGVGSADTGGLGTAIAPIDAMGCLDDIERTKKFIRAAYKAFLRVKESREGPVVILEAGSGPTPITLALAATLKKEDYRLIYRDYFPETVRALKKTVEKIGIADRCNIDQADLTYAFVKGNIDIVIVEVMDAALTKEPQAAVTFNLVRQLREVVVFIPENIEVRASTLVGNIELGELVSVGAKFREDARKSSWSQRKEMLSVNRNFEIPEDFEIPPTRKIPLRLDTEVKVFEDELIKPNQSRVTRKVIRHADLVAKRTLNFSYTLGSNPQ